MSPIRQTERARYPRDWKAISLRIRSQAMWRCECMGECGLHADPCHEQHGAAHSVTSSRVVLTVAHLDHTPENCAPENLRAMCQRCHLAYDAAHHRANAARTRRKGKAAGELPGLGAVEPAVEGNG